MIFTVFCCTFMNHCSPDSSTKTHISSHTKHVFSITLLSSHPHVFFHKGSHILSPKHAFFQRLFHRKLTYLPTQTMPSFKDSSKEYSHIISHKACLFNNSFLQTILSSSHPKHVYMHAFFHKESHILSPNPCPFSMALTHKIQFTYLPTQTPCLLSKALPQIIHISSHTNHAFFQRLFHG